MALKPRTLPPARPEKKTEYPKWVRGTEPGQAKIAKNAEEEAALRVEWGLTSAPVVAAPEPKAEPNLAELLKLGAVALAKRLQVELVEGGSVEDDLEMIALVLEDRAKKAFGQPGGEQQAVTEEMPSESEEDRVAGQNAPYTEIPDGWRVAHHSTIRKLARDLSGADVATTEEAIAIIERELVRRGNAD